MANPFNKAQPFLQQKQQMYQQNYAPYTEAGQNALGNVSDITQRMAQNPGEYFNQLISRYTPQKGFNEYRNNELMKAMRQSGYAGGYAGTEYDKEMQARLFNDLLESDRDKWIERILGINKTGLEGQGNLANMGLNATNSLSTGLGDTYGEEAELAFQSERMKQAKKNALFKQLLGIGGAGIGAFLGSPLGPKGMLAGAQTGYSIGSGSGFGGGASVDQDSWETGLGRRR